MDATASRAAVALLNPALMPEERSLSFDFESRPPRDEEPRALSVAELDRAIKDALSRVFARDVWVEGEVTGARAAPSGHLYFCLKDEHEDASIDVVVYRTSATPHVRQLCVDGARVRLRGRPTFWAPRGRLQLVADRAQAAGRGALLEALERLKAKLAAEGLFAAERKRAIPAEPRVIGVVTSAHGAAIHDVVRVAFRRGGARILLAAAQVQGQGAGESIVRAITQLQRVADVDIVIVGRGGGSAEDLAAFNDEHVVRAVAGCRVPIVSAVGHDVDVTLVDFAADARAATPSQAAELVVPDRNARRELLRRVQMHLARAPRHAIAARQQALDDRFARLGACGRVAIAGRRDCLSQAQRALAYMHPRAVLERHRREAARLTDRLATCWNATFERGANALQRACARLDALSPLAVLGRGYAIATRADGRAVRSANDVRAGDAIRVRVRDARIDASVERVDPVEERR